MNRHGSFLLSSLVAFLHKVLCQLIPIKFLGTLTLKEGVTGSFFEFVVRHFHCPEILPDFSPQLS
jgi:hypothetical protein